MPCVFAPSGKTGGKKPERKIHHEGTKDTKKNKDRLLGFTLLRVLRVFVVDLLILTRPG